MDFGDGADLIPLQEQTIDNVSYAEPVSQVPSHCGAGAILGSRPAAVIGGLVDMDGDGRADLFHGEEDAWYRNMGDGFDITHPIGLPSW